MPIMANAEHGGEKHPDTSLDRQLNAKPKQTTARTAITNANKPANSFIQYGEVWGCDDGFTKSGQKCVSIFANVGGQPENSYVQYRTIWGCEEGFRKESGKCVSIFTKKKVFPKKEDETAFSFSSK